VGQRERVRLKKEAEKSEVSELRYHGRVGAGLAGAPTAPEISVQGDDSVAYSHKKDRKKKRRWNERESTVHHSG